MPSFPDHFSRLASGYASYRPLYPDALFAWLATLPARHLLAWDCGAGSGQATLGLVPYFDRVLATDASAAQLAEAPADSRIEYRVARAEDGGPAAGTADLVTVAQALHWIDLGAFYPVVRDALAPGGVLAVWTYGVITLDDPALDRLLRHFYREVVGPYWPPERKHVESGYRSLPFPFEELPAPAFDMTAAWTLPELLGYVRTWSATARCRDATGHDPVLDLTSELSKGWGGDERIREIRWPLSLRIGKGSAG